MLQFPVGRIARHLRRGRVSLPPYQGMAWQEVADTPGCCELPGVVPPRSMLSAWERAPLSTWPPFWSIWPPRSWSWPATPPATTRRPASTPATFQLAVRNDEELSKLLGNVTIAGGAGCPDQALYM